MKNKIAVNSKFFKRSQAKGLLAHAKREFAEDKNVIDKSLTVENFGTKDEIINNRWTEALKNAPERTENLLIDSVLVLPLDALNELKKNNNNWKRELHERIGKIMFETENESGFKPIGYKVHLDEGHFDKEGNIILNPHAHLYFANYCDKEITMEKIKKVTKKDNNGKAIKKGNKYIYDKDEEGNILTEKINIPLKGRSPLSLHQTRGSKSIWSRQQDIAAKHLKDLGFERGDSAELTKAKHLDKSKYVQAQLSEQQLKIEANEVTLKGLTNKINELTDSAKYKISNFLNDREIYLKGILNNKNNKNNKDSLLFKLNNAVDSFNEINEFEIKKEVLNKTKERVETYSDESVNIFIERLNDSIKEEKTNKSNNPKQKNKINEEIKASF